MKRTWVVVIVAVATACGGGKPAAAPATQVSTDAAVPASAESPIVVQTEAMRARMCACKDRPCVAQVYGDLQAFVETLPKPSQTLTQQSLDNARRTNAIFLELSRCADTFLTANPDDCSTFITKARPILDAFAREDGRRAFSDAEYAYAVSACERGTSRPLQQVRTCVQKAIDDAAARYCWENSPISIGDETYSVMIRIEAEFQLDRMRRTLVALFNANGSFPNGVGELTPAGPPCCQRAGRVCPELDWDQVPWNTEGELIRPFGATMFQYSFSSNGKTVTAKAVGDIECDGTFENYTLKMSAKGDKPVGELIPPKMKPATK